VYLTNVCNTITIIIIVIILTLSKKYSQWSLRINTDVKVGIILSLFSQWLANCCATKRCWSAAPTL